MDDDFPASFSQTFHIRYDECGAGGAVRAAVHLRLFQEVAFGHSASVGFPLAWYEAQRLFWVARRLRLVLHTRVGYGEVITYTTQIAGARRVMARRLSTAVRARDGTRVADCMMDWIFTRDGAGSTRISADLAAAFPAMTRAVTPEPVEEPAPPPNVRRLPRHIRAGDLDPMGHVNHTVYADLLDDAVTREGGRAALDTYPRSYDLQYGAAAQLAEPLRDLAWRDGDVWHYRLERLEDPAVLFHGRLSPGVPASPSGG